MRYRILLFLCLALPLLQACIPVVALVATGGVLVSEDRRTSGALLEDQNIERKAGNMIREKFKSQAHINVTSYNRTVLLTGEAPSDTAKTEIEQFVRSVKNVRGTHNEIVIAGTSSFVARSSDTYLTSKVIARFLEAGKFQLNHIKLVTENSVVYLLGIVTHQEANDAVEVASTTGGVQKVIKLFEYKD